MSHINIPDKTKSQGSLDLQLFPQEGEEEKLELTSSSTTPEEKDNKKPGNPQHLQSLGQAV